MSDSLDIVSHEQDGRILTGVGVDAESLASTMERHAPDDAPTTPDESGTLPTKPEPTRNEQGQFAKPTRGQKRFDQLTGEREAEKRAREAAEKERDEYKAKWEAAQRPAQPEPPKTEAVRQPETPQQPITRQLLAQMPDALKTFDAFLQIMPDAEYEEFRDARNLWLYQAQSSSIQQEIDARIRTSIEADRASRTRTEHVSKIHERGRAAYADFDAITMQPHMLEPWPQDKIDVLADLEGVEHVQYQLGKDPDLARRLKDLSPVQFGMALSQLMTSAAVAQSASTARTVVPPPPAPMQPVAGGGKTTGPSSSDLANRGDFDYDKSGYREKRARERAVSSR